MRTVSDRPDPRADVGYVSPATRRYVEADGPYGKDGPPPTRTTKLWDVIKLATDGNGSGGWSVRYRGREVYVLGRFPYATARLDGDGARDVEKMLNELLSGPWVLESGDLCTKRR
jgi:hypothetical protein